jgi:tetratricopeptide (TPR) repeat protein
MKIGSYEVVGPLGEGGVGLVHRARSSDGRDVAIKVLRQSSADVVARFERERRLLQLFGEREGFVALLDAGATKHGPYLVMPFVAGGTLRARLAAGPLAVAEAVALVRKLALALGAAHARGIVHRDMKPENVLFTADGRPLIADLGLAKHFDRDKLGASRSVSLSRPGELRGTAGYMPIEQMQSAKEALPTVDVFALGAILHECLAGKPAFPGESLQEVFTQVERGAVTPLASACPAAPAWLEAVVLRALARDPARRFPDGAAFARALDAGPAPKRRSLLRHVLVGIALLLAIGVSLAFAFRAGERRRREQALAAAERAVAYIDSGDFARGSAEVRVALALDPACALAVTASGQVLFEKGDAAGALAAHERAIVLDPRCTRAMALRGACRVYRQEYRAAIEDFERAMAQEPDHTGCLSGRAYARTQLGDTSGALADYDRLIALRPESAYAWARRAGVRVARRELEAAERDFTRAIELSPSLAEAWSGRGAARLEMGRVEDARLDCTEALRRDPKCAEAWLTRSAAHESTREYALAAAELEILIKRTPDDYWAEEAQKRLERIKAEHPEAR